MKFVSLCMLVALAIGANCSYPSVCPKIVKRNQWGAKAPQEVDYVIIPVEYVVIHHTVTDTCSSEVSCSNILSNIQNFHMNDLKFHDIGYNFAIGGDGAVYEGAGWHKIGAHTRGYNTKSMGIAFIGNYVDKAPSAKQLQALKNFLACGVELGELSNRYNLIGARQVGSTQSPGLKLYQEIQKLPHFKKNP
ncbi:PREDICTED: peptidoglycan-recognition protein 2-like [Nicrophorus vespilloides]|uniref:Peptidoglycan-recognition protein n=1 Tax=Nicrophorus vespilloides TaxID=110193 RepID=A0ABM1MLD3_NICVS|nr:PREDICTED: peptidoglycan-recognition protein 2-like [Nicrophorus vespilloides]